MGVDDGRWMPGCLASGAEISVREYAEQAPDAPSVARWVSKSRGPCHLRRRGWTWCAWYYTVPGTRADCAPLPVPTMDALAPHTSLGAVRCHLGRANAWRSHLTRSDGAEPPRAGLRLPSWSAAPPPPPPRAPRCRAVLRPRPVRRRRWWLCRSTRAGAAATRQPRRCPPRRCPWPRWWASSCLAASPGALGAARSRRASSPLRPGPVPASCSKAAERRL